MMKRSVRWEILPVLLLLAAGPLGCAPAGEEWSRLVRDGNRAFEAGDYRRAEEAFSRALELRPAEPGVLANRGNARMMMGNAEGALADYDDALEADPNFAQGYANRGILRDRRGDAAGAAADYRKALALDPSLGKGPGILDRILHDRPATTIADRLEFLERLSAGPRPADPSGSSDRRP